MVANTTAVTTPPSIQSGSALSSRKRVIRVFVAQRREWYHHSVWGLQLNPVELLRTMLPPVVGGMSVVIGLACLIACATGAGLVRGMEVRHRVSCLAISPDGRWLASAGRFDSSGGRTRGVVQLLDYKSGRSHRFLGKHKSFVRSVVFSPSGDHVAAGGDDGRVSLWETRTGKLVWEREAKEQGYWQIFAVAFSRDGKLLAGGGHFVSDTSNLEHGLVHVWSTDKGELKHTLANRSHGVFCLTFLNQGKTIATGGIGGAILLWDVETATIRSRLPMDMEIPQSLVSLAEDGLLVVGSSSGSSGSRWTWDVVSGEVKRRIEADQGPISAIATSKDGKRVATVSNSSATVRVWDASTGQQIMSWGGGIQVRDVWSVAFSPDSLELVIGGLDKRIRWIQIGQ